MAFPYFFPFCVVWIVSAGYGTVKIFRHWISQNVDSTNQSTSIILDCDYQYDIEDDVKLVVRWFYNDSPEPIYQWIPESDSRYVGQSIQKYFDMNFQIGDDRFTKFRAIRLMPQINSYDRNNHRIFPFPLELSGNYTCVISSITSQDSRQGNVLFYVPPHKFEFNIFSSDGNLNLNHQTNLNRGLNNNDDGPMVRCRAESVYPKPLMTFSELVTNDQNYHHLPYHQSSIYSSIGMPSSSTLYSYPPIEVISVMNETTELYSSWFEYKLNVDSIKVGTIYECRLEIPSTQYIRKKRIKLIYPSTYYTSRSNDHQQGKNDHNNHHHHQQQLQNYGHKVRQEFSDFQAQQHQNNNRNNKANSIHQSHHHYHLPTTIISVTIAFFFIIR